MPVLEEIVCDRSCFREGEYFRLVDFPQLRRVALEDSCFYPTKEVRFERGCGVWGE